MCPVPPQQAAETIIFPEPGVQLSHGLAAPPNALRRMEGQPGGTWRPGWAWPCWVAAGQGALGKLEALVGSGAGGDGAGEGTARLSCDLYPLHSLSGAGATR